MSKEERAQARADKAARKAARPWPLRHWMLTGIGVIVIIVIIATASSSGSKNTPSAADTVSSSPTPSSETAGKVFQHPEDVKITSCGVDDAGFADAKLTITNHSAKASDYVVTVAFESPDGSKQVGTGTALVNSLQPGQSSDQDVNSLTSATAGSFVCKISSAQRNASY